MIFTEVNRLTTFFFLGLAFGSGGSARTTFAVEAEPSVAGSGTAATGWMICGCGETLISPILRSARLIVWRSVGSELEMLRSMKDSCPIRWARAIFWAWTGVTSRVAAFATLGLPSTSSTFWSIPKILTFCNKISVISLPASSRVSRMSTLSPGSTNPATPEVSLMRIVTARMFLSRIVDRVAFSPKPDTLPGRIGSPGEIGRSTTLSSPLPKSSSTVLKAPVGTLSNGHLISRTCSAAILLP